MSQPAERGPAVSPATNGPVGVSPTEAGPTLPVLGAIGGGQGGSNPPTPSASSSEDMMAYKGITFCDNCGKPLERGQWLSGLCRRCEEVKAPKRPVSSLKPEKALGDE